MHLNFPFKIGITDTGVALGWQSDKAIFVYFYQVISFILTVRPDSVVAALLSYVSILFENHSNNSQNEWKWFVIGPLEKSSVTDTFSVSRMMMIAGLWMSEVCQHGDHSGSVSGHWSWDGRLRDWGQGTAQSRRERGST